tara:strand:+ start:19171 stop:20988 length:1818 start_codon:yes stop_codon:yes gene_type:complete
MRDGKYEGMVSRGTRIVKKTIIRRGAANFLFSKNIDPVLQRVYSNRGITDMSMVNKTLCDLPHPSKMLGIESAVQRLIDALQLKQKVLIIGDFDADGATSTALMILGLGSLGFSSVQYLVPNRFEFGYGLTREIVDLAIGLKPALIITVDNGISSYQGVEKASQYGVDVIITDHHLPGEELPDAYSIINPNQIGCKFPSKNLAGVGVAFYLLLALRTALRENNWFVSRDIGEPNLAVWLDLVALGTIADVVPLDQVNRTLVHHGLKRIREGYCRPGISAMLRVAGKNQSGVNASDLGFKVGPSLNAAGRLKDISIGIQCLLTNDVGTALELAKHLNTLNQERRALEESMQVEAQHLLEGLQLGQSERLPNVICLYKPDWHEGILGLLASRIKERYHRPVLICARESASVGPSYQVKGSCRSIPKLHIRDALSAVALKHADLAMKFGGHAMAAGFSIREDRLELLFTALRKYVGTTLKNEDFNDVCLTDGELDITQINIKTAMLLDEAGPWGPKFPEPTFDGIFIVERQQILKKKYLKMTLSFPEQRDSMLDAICFNVDVNEWNNDKINALHCVYRLQRNEYRGIERLQLLIDYFQPIHQKKAVSV